MSAEAQVRAQLLELADLLDGLDEAGWQHASLCAGWRVREVAAHIVLPMFSSQPAVLVGLVRTRFRWHVLADRLARRDAARPPADLVAALRSPRMHAWTPPGGGPTGALVHAVVHGLDITEALGLPHELPPARTRLVLDGLVHPKSLRHFGVDVAGRRLIANDVDWSYGSGRLVEADAANLAPLLSGRRDLQSLDGVTDTDPSATGGTRSR